MTDVGLTSGEQFLRDSARTFFEELYENPEMHVGEELHRDLFWTPALWFTIHEQIGIFVEPSETSASATLAFLNARTETYVVSQNR